MEANNFEERLNEVSEMVKRLQSTLMLYQSKLEEFFTQAHKYLSLVFETFHGSIKSVKEEKEAQVDSLGVQLNRRSLNKKVKARLF